MPRTRDLNALAFERNKLLTISPSLKIIPVLIETASTMVRQVPREEDDGRVRVTRLCLHLVSLVSRWTRVILRYRSFARTIAERLRLRW